MGSKTQDHLVFLCGSGVLHFSIGHYPRVCVWISGFVRRCSYYIAIAGVHNRNVQESDC